MTAGDVVHRDTAHQRWSPKGSALLGQMTRFAGIGVLSTLAYLLLFLLFREPLGAQGANLVCLLITAVGNTLLNRRFTFGVSGAQRRTRHLAQGLMVFVLALALTSGSLAIMHAVSARPARIVELAVLVMANLAATGLRFTLLRQWVFRHRRLPGTHTPRQEAATS